jgi:hypothetical protein
VSALFLNTYKYSIQTLNYVTLKKKVYTSMFLFEDLERPRSTGGDLENELCGYNFYHEDELQ